ncbi:MAG: hypothetical protein ACYC0X_27955 [Pirellulaceae bacterium]
MARKASIAKRPNDKFPLWQHGATGQWAKKIQQHVNYFGNHPNAVCAEIRV